MQELRQLQQDFAKEFVTPNEKSAFVGRIQSSENLTAEQRFNIYCNSISEGITHALSTTFPVCNKLVGEEFFGGLCRYFIKHFPSHSPNLNDYGEDFAQFIENFEHTQSVPYMSDVARLEWAWHKVYLSIKDNYLISSSYPIHKIWEVNQDDYEGDMYVNLDEGKVKLVVWKTPDGTMRMDVATDEQWELLNAAS